MATRVLVAAFAGAATIAGGTSARAEEPLRVGVVTGVHVNVPAEDAVEISRALGEAIQNELLVESVAGGEAHAALEPEGVPEGCITDSDCLKRLAERLATDQVLVLVVLRVGDRLRIEATWADAESGEPVDRPPINLNQGIEHAAAIFSDFAPRLLPGAQPRAKKAVEDAPPDGGTGAGGGTGGATGGGGSEIGPGGSGPGAGAGGPVDRPRGRHMTTGAWTALGVFGGIWAVTATVGFIEDRRRPDDQEREDLNKTLDIVGISSLGLGVVTVGVLYYLSDGDEPAQRGTVRVQQGPGDFGVSFGGVF